MLPAAPTLVIGNKNYSSWSLRPWLLLTHFNIDFEETSVSLAPQGLSDRLQSYSPVGKVPVLLHNSSIIWDSLAICEYISEVFLKNTGWPDEPMQRAQARSLCAEMHSGFMALRQHCPMNVREHRSVEMTEALRKDLQRIDEIWSECAAYSATGWLFDQFSIADCFFAPVAFRCQSYDLPLSPHAQQYCKKLLNLPAMRQWAHQSGKENEVLTHYHVGEIVA